MITLHIKPSAFWRRQPSVQLFVQDQHRVKLRGVMDNLAAMVKR